MSEKLKLSGSQPHAAGSHAVLHSGRAELLRMERSGAAKAFREAFGPSCEQFSRSVMGLEAGLLRKELMGVSGPVIFSRPVAFSPSLGDCLGLPYNRLNAITSGFAGSYRYSSRPANEPSWGLPPLKMPVGEHGRLFALRLLAATSLLATLAVQNLQLQESLKQLMRANEGLFDKLDLKADPLDTFKDGIRSVGLSAAMLTAERVDGYDTPEKLMAAAFGRSLPKELSLILPFGFIGRAAFAGRRIPGILRRDARGEPCLAPEFLDSVKEIRDAVRAGLGHKDRPAKHTWGDGNSGAIGFGCPVGRKGFGEEKTGIDHLCGAFLHVYDVLFGGHSNLNGRMILAMLRGRLHL